MHIHTCVCVYIHIIYVCYIIKYIYRYTINRYYVILCPNVSGSGANGDEARHSGQIKCKIRGDEPRKMGLPPRNMDFIGLNTYIGLARRHPNSGD